MDPSFDKKAPQFFGYEPALITEDVPLIEQLNEELRRIADLINTFVPAYGQIYRVTPATPGAFTTGTTPAVITFDGQTPVSGAVSGVERNPGAGTLVASKVRGTFSVHFHLTAEISAAKQYTLEAYVNGAATGLKSITTLTGASTDMEASLGGLVSLKEGDSLDIRVSSPGPADTFDVLSGTLFMTRIA